MTVAMFDDSGKLTTQIQLRDDDGAAPPEETPDAQVRHWQQDLGEQSSHLVAGCLGAGHGLLDRPQRTAPTHNGNSCVVVTPFLDNVGPQG